MNNPSTVHSDKVTLNQISEFDEKREPLQITDSWRRLEGHSARVTGLAWSAHTDGFLVSVSYDGNALVIFLK